MSLYLQLLQLILPPHFSMETKTPSKNSYFQVQIQPIFEQIFNIIKNVKIFIKVSVKHTNKQESDNS